MIEQRTDEWFAQRLGKVTASNLDAVMATGRNGSPSVSRANYMSQLLIQRLGGASFDSVPMTDAIQWGIEKEDEARVNYEFDNDCDIEEVGFIDHPTIDMTGASPDGLVGSDGLVEIKCPNTTTHFEFIDSGKISRKYMLQMQWQMACTERSWCDFISYDPRLPTGLQMEIKRIHIDEEKVASITEKVKRFLYELDEKESRYRERLV